MPFPSRRTKAINARLIGICKNLVCLSQIESAFMPQLGLFSRPNAPGVTARDRPPSATCGAESRSGARHSTRQFSTTFQLAARVCRSPPIACTQVTRKALEAHACAGGPPYPVEPKSRGRLSKRSATGRERVRDHILDFSALRFFSSFSRSGTTRATRLCTSSRTSFHRLSSSVHSPSKPSGT